jgi:hypothetical protein
MVTLHSLSVVDLVEMDLLYIQIHPSQATKIVLKFQITLLTNVQMQVFLLTSQVTEFKCTQ